MELLNVSLQEQVLQLQVIVPKEGPKTPAYTIMRKVIAKASYHRQQLDRYEATVYIKGSGRLKDSPFFPAQSHRKGRHRLYGGVPSRVGQPDRIPAMNTFKERVISIYSQGTATIPEPNNYINGGFTSRRSEAVSPLSPKAFGITNFSTRDSSWTGAAASTRSA